MNHPPTALVTGASSGIGRETALMLAGHGYQVVAAARRLDRLEELAAEHPGVTPRPVDLADSRQLDLFCAELLGRGPLDVLVNNAGYAIRGVVEAVEDAEIRRMFDVNVFALLKVTRACLPAMRAAQKGRIVNLSSIAGRFAFPGSGPYASTKHAVEALTDALRHEMAPFGIQVIVVRPGPIATEFNDVAGEMSQGPAGRTPGAYAPVTAAVGAGFGRIFGQLDIPGPRAAAEVILEAILAETPKAAYDIGPLTDTYLPKRKELDDDDWKKFIDKEVGIEGLKV